MAEEQNEVDVKQLAATVNSLATMMTGMGRNMEILTNSMKDLKDGVTAKPKADPDDDEDSVDTDLESMTRADFANHLMAQFGKVMKGQLKDIQDAVQQTSARVQEVDVKAMVKEARAKNKDFDEWGQELKQTLTDNPTLTIDRALTLVRSEHPEKAKELREKYEMDSPSDLGKPMEKGQGRDKFGGLPPKGGGDTEKTGQMDTAEAVEDAWESSLAASEGLDPDYLTGTN